MACMLVRNHHEGHPTAGRHVAEELFHGLQAASGGADPDEQETGRFCGQFCRWSRLRPRDHVLHRTRFGTLVLRAGLGRNCSTMRLSCRSHGGFSSA